MVAEQRRLRSLCLLRLRLLRCHSYRAWLLEDGCPHGHADRKCDDESSEPYPLSREKPKESVGEKGKGAPLLEELELSSPSLVIDPVRHLVESAAAE